MEQEKFENLFEIAKIKFNEKKFSDAKNFLLEYIDGNPTLEAINLLGIVYINLNENHEAILLFKNLISKNYIDENIYNNLGIALKKNKNYSSAIDHFNLSIKINKKSISSYFNLGNTYAEIGQNRNSEKNFRKCLRFNKNYLPAIINLSALYINKRSLDKAMKVLKNYLKKNPDNLEILENIAKIYLIKKQFSKAEFFIKKIVSIFPTANNKLIPVALGFLYQGNSRKYFSITKSYTQKLTNKSSIFKLNYNHKNRNLKIGFVTPDLRSHPIGFFLKDMLPVLSKKIDINIFNTGVHQDQISEYSKEYVKWIDCENKNFEQLSELIYEKNLDTLVDTSGMTRTNNLNVFRLKPVKKQISWAGWLATTKMKEIDYIIGDNYATPKKDDKNFTEKVYRMENIWCTYSRSLLENNMIKKRAIHSNEITFGCFQRPEKINQNVIRTWSNILLKKKNSIIIFINKSFDSYEKKRIINSFKKYNVNLSQIFFKIPLNRLDYINNFNFVDINLDTFPYNGGTTSFESTFMNVPTLTLRNNSCMFRCGESINQNLNMRDWIAKNEDEYIQKALSFCNKKYISDIKNKLNEMNSNSLLFDSKQFSNEFVKMLEKIN